MKVIYVDIDGPLATDECSRTVEKTKWHPKLYRMNENCVRILNEIIQETECELIVSSDWRKHFSLQYLGEIFEWNGIIKKPIAITGLETVSWGNSALNRIHQIKNSLEEHKPTAWVAIDDLPLGGNEHREGLLNYVYCDMIDGLTGENKKEEVVNFLKV